MFAGGLGGGKGASAGRGMTSRPAFKTCYLCGQQFGSASIGIHVPQCYQKKLAQWHNANPATRGNKPKDPDTVNWKGNPTMTNRQMNDEQYREFASNLSPCPQCGRTFAPDRLPVHLRGCKGTGSGGGGSSATARTSTASGKVPRSSHGGGTSTSARLGSSARPTSKAGSQVRRSVSANRDKGAPPQLPFCYLCGRQFGTTSLNIHVPQCYAKKLAQWQNADPGTRGKAPKHPDDVKTTTQTMSMQEQSDAQFQEFVSNLEPCPNCARRFLPDRLAVHLKSCRPGNTAKPVHAAAASAKAAPPLRSAVGTTRPGSAGAVEADPNGSTDEDVERVHPRRNRIPKNSGMSSCGRTCSNCSAVEYDEKAKFCRECGQNLREKGRQEPCAACGDNVPIGSRFCPTCGEPVNGAAAHERTAGAQNENAGTTRMIVCSACEAICDEDGNFCDNCGAMLELEGGSGASRGDSAKAMFCESCHEYVNDLSCAFCEDCGAKLVPRERPSVSQTARTAVQGRSPDAKQEPRVPAKTKSASVPKGGASSGAAGGRGASTNAYAPLPDEAFEEDFSYRQACPHCQRKFAPETYERHVGICGATKKRPTFNMTKQRLGDVADARTIQKVSRNMKKSGQSTAAAPAPPKKDWRAESQAFRRAMREARQVDTVLKTGGTAADLPPPTYSENAHYVQCPHCTRRFAPDVAERHIPKCATTVNKPKAPPRRRF